MALKEFQITSILGGQSPLRHGAGKGQFLLSLSVDPEVQLDGAADGFIIPTAVTKFSSTGLSGAPMWIETNPTDSLVYVYADDGELISYDNSLASETVIGTPTNGSGNGMAFINDHLIIPTDDDIAVYGPLSSSPTIDSTWGTVTGGLTALIDTTYPSIRSVAYPNHMAFRHSDGFVYVCNFHDNQGFIDRVGITAAGANNGSLSDVLDLPVDVRPFVISNYGTDLAIAGSVVGTTAQLRKGTSTLFLWDTFEDSFWREVPIPSAMVTAMLNINGRLYIWGAGANNGWQLYVYDGGETIEELYDSSVGSSPFAGAVDSQNGRIFWGSFDTRQTDIACVYAWGYQGSALPKRALHNVLTPAGLAATSIVSAVKCVDNLTSKEYPIFGHRDSTPSYGLSRYSESGTQNGVFRSESFIVGKRFKIRELRVPITGAVASGLVNKPTIVFDNGASTITLTEINNTNFSGATEVHYKAMEIDALGSGVIGRNDFYVQFQFDAGTVNKGVALPVSILVETLDD